MAAAQTAWFVVFPSSETETGATGIPPGSKIISAQAGSAAYNAWTGNGAYDGWQVLSGPFTSAGAAQAWSPAPLTTSDWVRAGIAGALIGAGGQSPAAAVANSSTTLTGLAAIGDFFQRLTQGATWIRIAEGILGLGLIIVGLAKLASGTAVGKAAARAGKAAAIL
jgi:hypothetical protein